MTNVFGWTAMMFAIAKDYVKIVQLLLPCEGMMQEFRGWTPYQVALLYERTDAAKILLAYEVEYRTRRGKIPIVASATYYDPQYLDLEYANAVVEGLEEVPPIIASALQGNFQCLQASQKEWNAGCAGLTLLDLAILRNQRQAVRVLLSSENLWGFFEQESISKFAEAKSDVSHALCCNDALFDEVLPLIYRAASGCKSQLTVRAFVMGKPYIARILRSTCTLDVDSIHQGFRFLLEENDAVKFLKDLKNIGFSSNGMTVLGAVSDTQALVAALIQANPLRNRQIEQAGRDVENRAPETMQACWREEDAESFFNRFLLLESRDVAWGASPASKPIHDVNTNSIEHKQTRVSLFLVASHQFMFRVIQAMLDE